MPLIYVIGSSRQKEAAALKIKATASKARENISALRRPFFFCRRPAGKMNNQLQNGVILQSLSAYI